MSQQAEPQPEHAGPIAWLRTLNGDPDWQEDCVHAYEDDARRNLNAYIEGAGEGEVYSIIPLYAAPPAQAEPQPFHVTAETKIGVRPDGSPLLNNAQPQPDVAALVEEVLAMAYERAGGGSSEQNYDPALLDLMTRAADRLTALAAERDAVVRQMQTFNAVVAERDAKIVAASDARDRAREALRAIRDSRYRNALTLRGIANNALAEGKE